MNFLTSKKQWLTAGIGLLALALNACTPIQTATTPTPTPTPTPCSGSDCVVPAGKVDVLVNTTELASDGQRSVLITVRVRSASNTAIKDADVALASDSGDLVVASPITDSSGIVQATLTPGTNKANRTITITATSGTVTGTNSVNVTGTAISTSGANSTTINTPLTVKATVRDSAGAPIPNTTVAVTSSAAALALDKTSGTTNASGEISVIATPSAGGTFSINFAALGATQSHDVTAAGDNFTIDSGSALKDGSSLLVNTDGSVTVSWIKNGAAFAGQNVTFSITRGSFTESSSGTYTAATDNNGKITAHPRSSSTGIATLTAAGASGTPSTNLQFTYITNQATQVELQPASTTVNANTAGSSTNKISLPALVRDGSNNLVKDATVTFTILKDTSGGTLSSTSATTDISGRATIDYIAGTGTSGQSGVEIQATVTSIKGVAITPAAQPKNTVTLTVGGKALFIRIGTDNKIETLNKMYVKTFTTVVSDATGKGVPGQQVKYIITPLRYFKGEFSIANALVWYSIYSLPGGTGIGGGCPSEDLNNNGTKDPGEDINGDGDLTPGIPVVLNYPENTDEFGVSQMTMRYPPDQAYWAEFEITVTTGTAGTEASSKTKILLPGPVGDYNSKDIPPPGRYSPYGQSSVCTNAL